MQATESAAYVRLDAESHSETRPPLPRHAKRGKTYKRFILFVATKARKRAHEKLDA